MRVAVGAIIIAFGFLLIWPLVAGFFAWANRKCTLITTVEQISRKIPKKLIPGRADGWNASKDRINAKLKSLIGRPATLGFMPEKCELTPDGRYEGVPRMIAQRNHPDSATGLPVYLYAYFTCADAELIRRVIRHMKNDRIDVNGRILRADIEWINGKFVFSIDLSHCTFA